MFITTDYESFPLSAVTCITAKERGRYQVKVDDKVHNCWDCDLLGLTTYRPCPAEVAIVEVVLKEDGEVWLIEHGAANTIASNPFLFEKVFCNGLIDPWEISQGNSCNSKFFHRKPDGSYIDTVCSDHAAAADTIMDIGKGAIERKQAVAEAIAGARAAKTKDAA